MSKAEVYRSPVDVALSLESELEAYDKDKDRRALLNAVKEQFLLNRLVSASQAENTRGLGLQILRNRMEHMSDNMLVKTIKQLSKMGETDLAAIAGGPIPGRSSPMVSIQQAFGLPGGSAPVSLEGLGTSNPVKDVGMILEAVEQASAYLRAKGPVRSS